MNDHVTKFRDRLVSAYNKTKYNKYNSDCKHFKLYFRTTLIDNDTTNLFIFPIVFLSIPTYNETGCTLQARTLNTSCSGIHVHVAGTICYLLSSLFYLLFKRTIFIQYLFIMHICLKNIYTNKIHKIIRRLYFFF